MPKDKLDIKPVSVLVNNFTLSSVMDDEFLGLMTKTFPKVKAAMIVFFHEEENEETKKNIKTIRLFYDSPKNQKDDVLSVTCEDPEDLEKALGIIKKYSQQG